MMPPVCVRFVDKSQSMGFLRGRKFMSARRIFLLASGALTFCTAQINAATFQGLGLPPDQGVELPFSAVTSMSGDGSKVGGLWGSDVCCGYDSFTWTNASGAQRLLANTGASVRGGVYVRSMSYDGSVVAGGMLNPIGTFLQVGAGPGEILANPPNSYQGYIRALSSDGTVGIASFNDVSTGGINSFLFSTQSKTWSLIDQSPSALFTQATGISPDGKTVFGRFSGEGDITGQAATWRQADGWRLLPSLTGSTDAYLSAVSSNADIIVGSSLDASRNSTAFRWTTSEGAEALGSLAGETYSTAADVSADGRFVVGAGYDGTFRARIWDAKTGSARLVSDLLAEQGVDLGGWQLTTADQISDDGSFIAGGGIDPQGRRQAWIANLAPVPEASQWILMLAGLAVVVAVSRTRSPRRQ